MSEILARPSLRKEHLRKPQDKKNVPAKLHGIWREKIFKLMAEDKATFYSLVEIKSPVLVSKNTEERMQTNEEAQVYVYDLDLFVTVQLQSRRGFTQLSESPNVHIEGSRPSKTPPNFPRKDPREREERMTIVAGEGKKKARKFGRPPSGPHCSGRSPPVPK